MHRSLYSLPIVLFLFLSVLLNAQTPTMEVGTHDYLLKEDVLWASPKGFDLTMDIYTPQTGKDSYPVIVVYHGGGWLINNNSIMDQGAAYLASHGEYVVCNVNYRLLGDLDNTTTLDEIVEDALGAFVWVKYHIADYQGNPNEITVTGDSAGGHLAMMVTQQGTHLSNNGFDEGPNGFAPTWLPEGKQAEDLSELMEVQAAILSYGAFDMYVVGQSGFETAANFFWQMGNAEARGIFGNDKNVETHPDYYKKISPIYNIPSPAEKDLPPMLFTVGELDQTTPAVSIEAFMDKLKEAGHDEMTYWIHEGRPHAFLDSGRNDYLGIVFEEDAIPALEVMLDFLNGVFYE